MQKGENVISIALAAVVVLTIIAIQRKWRPATLQEMATSAEDFILTTTGIQGQLPDIPGYEKVKTFKLEQYRAVLYRASPAPLVFAPGRFIIYNRQNQPVFKLETLEGSKDAWTEVYDFKGRRGLAVAGSRQRPELTRALAGNALPGIIIGQYSGGDHCCTIATVVELGKDSVKALGRIEGLDGVPFEGLELRKINKDPSWEIIASRPYSTSCGSHDDAADVLAVYGFENGQLKDQTQRYVEYVQSVLKQNLGRWAKSKNRTLQLLQTLAVDYAQLGERDQGRRFFAMNLGQFMPDLKQKGVDPNGCIEDLENLVAKLPSIVPPPQ